MNRKIASNPIRVEGMTIIPLESLTVHHHTTKGGLVLQVSAEPIGIVVHSAGGDRAIGLDGKDVPLESCLKEVEGLRELLESL